MIFICVNHKNHNDLRSILFFVDLCKRSNVFRNERFLLLKSELFFYRTRCNSGSRSCFAILSASPAPSLLKLQTNKFFIGWSALIFFIASKAICFVNPFPLYSGSVEAEHKYNASYFMFSGVLFSSSVSEISFAMN